MGYQSSYHFHLRIKIILRNDIIMETNEMRMADATSVVKCNLYDELLQLNIIKDHINSKHKERKLELLHKLERILSCQAHL